MLAETSKARMTVPSSRGRLTTACGRASASVMTISPPSNSAAGIRPRRRARACQPPPARGRLRRTWPDDGAGAHRAFDTATRPIGMSARASSIGGQMNDIGLPPPLPSDRGHADDGADQILVGRKRQGLDPGSLEGALTSASRRLRRFLEAASESGVVRVDVELLARLGIVHDQRTDVGQLDLARVEEANGEDLVPSGSAGSAGRSHPGALMKSETMKTSERRLMVCSPALEQRRQVGERRARHARMTHGARR